jgi:hypothetical protein
MGNVLGFYFSSGNQALKLRKVDTVMVRIPDEYHGAAGRHVSKPPCASRITCARTGCAACEGGSDAGVTREHGEERRLSARPGELPAPQR